MEWESRNRQRTRALRKRMRLFRNTSLPTCLIQTGYAEDSLNVTSLDRGFASATNCQRFNRGISLCCQCPGHPPRNTAHPINQCASEIAQSALCAGDSNRTSNFTGIFRTDTSADTGTRTTPTTDPGFSPSPPTALPAPPSPAASMVRAERMSAGTFPSPIRTIMG